MAGALAMSTDDKFPDVKRAAPGIAHIYRRVEAEKAALPPVAPVAAAPSRWNDPEDTVNTRDPIQIKGYRRGDVLRRLNRRGRDITEDHIEAARLFACDWDVATLGLTSPENPLLTAGVQSGGGPAMGPKARDVARLRAARDVDRVQTAIGDAAWPLLHWVVCSDRDVTGWVDVHKTLPEPHRRDLDLKKELGKLIAILDRLAEHYGVDSRRDAAIRARRESERK